MLIDRWSTGWVVLEATADLPYVAPRHGHRPDPDDRTHAMCGRELDPAVRPLPAPPLGIPGCGRCALLIGRARKRARKAAGLPRPRRLDPEAVDRRDRRTQRGTSVRTVVGGLPTLGRRH